MIMMTIRIVMLMMMTAMRLAKMMMMTAIRIVMITSTIMFLALISVMVFVNTATLSRNLFRFSMTIAYRSV